jgi:hypothetical protein
MRTLRDVFPLRPLRLLMFIGGLLVASSAAAQDGRENILFDGHVMVILPRGDFEKEFHSVGLGAGLDLGYVFMPMPLAVGLGGSWATYGEKTFRATFNDGFFERFGEATVTNSIVMINPFVRLQPNEGVFRPYIEFNAGMSFFNTSTSFKDVGTGNEIGSETKNLNVGFFYGTSGGIAFRVYTGKADENGEKSFQIYVDLRLRYLKGSTVKYYLADAMYFDNASREIAFDAAKRRSSTTDMIVPFLGVMIRAQ